MSYQNRLPSDYVQEETLNPGQRIRFLLEERYDQEKYLETIDYELRCGGDLKKIVYESTLNYVLRRFMASAAFIHRRFASEGDGKVRTELRKYFLDHTAIGDKLVADMIGLLMEVMSNMDDNFNDTERRVAKKQVLEYGWCCYICGQSIHFTDSEDPVKRALRATADHKWPRFFGGSSSQGNLRYACSDCNSKYKKDFLDYSDYHFEEIAFVIDTYEAYLEKSRNRSYEAAIFARSDFKCSTCDQPAYRVGALSIGRVDTNDSWHYLNLTAYCQQHNPE